MVKEVFTGAPMRDPRSYLKKEEIISIINHTEKREFKRLFIFLMMTGRRVSEVVRCLVPEDIDFENHLVNFKILKRKDKEYRSLLPVSEKALEMLKFQIKKERIAPGRYIFPMSRQRVDQLFKRAAEDAGIFTVGRGVRNRPHIHLLRHSFAIEGAKKLKTPADLTELQAMLGHSRIDTTMFYLKFNPSEKREMLKEMWK